MVESFAIFVLKLKHKNGAKMRVLNSEEISLIGGGWNWMQVAGGLTFSTLGSAIIHPHLEEVSSEPTRSLAVIFHALTNGYIGSIIADGLWHWRENQVADYNARNQIK
jgi:hypothetical protein